MVWTGTEASVSSEGGTAAYDPVTDRWRRLADRGVRSSAFWTGDSIIGMDSIAVDGLWTRYDVAGDSWTAVDGSYATVVGVPDADEIMSTFLALPRDAGVPVQVLDSDLKPIGELPAYPGDRFFVHRIGASAMWVGEEVIFNIWSTTAPWPEQVWALNPTTQTWRHLDPAVPWGLVAAGDVMLAWGAKSGTA